MITSETLDTMQRNGGSFVKQLAVLYRHADAANARLLEETFADYFTEYAKIAARFPHTPKQG